MKQVCTIPECNVDSVFHLTAVEGNQRVREQVLCEKHGFAELKKYESNQAVDIRVPSLRFEVALLAYNSKDNVHHIHLREVGGKRYFAWTNGYIEAAQLYNLVSRVEVGRPLTHPALVSIISKLGGVIDSVAITRRETECYLAEVRILHNNSIVAADLRPSDAISLAVCANAPILVSTDLL